MLLRKLKNIYHLFQAMAANLVYGWPSRKLICIGVTGTDGKSTTVNLIYDVLRLAGERVGMISTVGAKINDEDVAIGFHTTTPDSFALQKILSTMVKNTCKYAVIEVASHGIDQNRIWGINFKVGVLTNITREHLDYHKTMIDYIKTKLSFLRECRMIVVNADFSDFTFGDDEKSFWDTFLKSKKFSSRNITTYGIDKGFSQAVNLKHGEFTFIPAFTAAEKEKSFVVTHNLMGKFNVENILAAVVTCLLLEVKEQKILDAVSKFRGISGRLEKIENNKNLHVYVDFAHTPNAIEQVLKTLKQEFPESKIIHVFGATGKRDQAKRPEMGAMSGKLADVSIITTEDTYGEAPERIISMIETGMKETDEKRGETYFVEPERKKALEFAVRLAHEGDVIVATGVGHQRTLNVGREIPWSDQEELRKILSLNK